MSQLIRTVEWVHLRADELRHLASLEESVVILPSGAVEQHGTHLPEGTDTLTVHRVALDAASALSKDIPVLVLPAISVGVSLHHMQFPGTVTLSPQTFRAVVEEVVDSVFKHGFQRLLLLNGHGGNNIHLRVSSVGISEKWGRVVPVANYWDLMPSGREHLHEDPLAFPGHAGEFETAIQLHLFEEDVDMTQAKPSYRISRSPYVPNQVFLYRNYMDYTQGTGVYGDPSLATKKKGKALFELAVQGLVSFINDFSKWDVNDAGSLFADHKQQES
jgi:creatinine amidohydrolase